MSAVIIGALGAKINEVTSRGTRITAAGSGSYTPTVTGWHLVRLQAAGGAGGGGSQFATDHWGGAAGEYFEIKQYLIAETAYSYTVPGATVGISGVGPNGGNTVFVGPQKTYTAIGGSGASDTGLSNTLHRRDGVATSKAPALFAGPGCLYGANGGAGNSYGGYCSQHQGGASLGGGGGGGGASLYAPGGDGGGHWNTPGAAAGTGAGDGGAASNGIATAGGNGGPGLIEIEYLGAI